MSELVSLKAIVYGRVQGVFFRDFVNRQASELGITGYVRNLHVGNAVEVVAEGARGQLDKLIGHLKIGPSGARVERVVTDWSEYTGSYSSFGVRY